MKWSIIASFAAGALALPNGHYGGWSNTTTPAKTSTVTTTKFITSTVTCDKQKDCGPGSTCIGSTVWKTTTEDCVTTTDKYGHTTTITLQPTITTTKVTTTDSHGKTTTIVLCPAVTTVPAPQQPAPQQPAKTTIVPAPGQPAPNTPVPAPQSPAKTTVQAPGQTSQYVCPAASCPAPSTITKTVTVTAPGAPAQCPPQTTYVQPPTTKAPVTSTTVVSTPSTSKAPVTSTTVVSTPSTSRYSTSSAPTPSSSCPVVLAGTSYEYPHLIEVNGVNGYNGSLSSTQKTDLTFDIPSDAAGKTCTAVFALPAPNTLETSAYTLTGNGVVTVTSNGKTVSSFTPAQNNKYTLQSLPCPAGQQLKYELSISGNGFLQWFNDYNPCPLGAFVLKN